MTDTVQMSSSKPYLIRALYDWIVDNELTPHLLVNAAMQGVKVPEEYVESGRIILNISPSAVQDLQLSNDWIHFDARFSSETSHILVPIGAVIAIYAHENGRGMVFDPQTEENTGGSDHEPPPPPPKIKKKPNLIVVK
jgi:stringent starvation protein B